MFPPLIRGWRVMFVDSKLIEHMSHLQWKLNILFLKCLFLRILKFWIGDFKPACYACSWRNIQWRHASCVFQSWIFQIIHWLDCPPKWVRLAHYRLVQVLWFIFSQDFSFLNSSWCLEEIWHLSIISNNITLFTYLKIFFWLMKKDRFKKFLLNRIEIKIQP